MKQKAEIMNNTKSILRNMKNKKQRISFPFTIIKETN